MEVVIYELEGSVFLSLDYTYLVGNACLLISKNYFMDYRIT